MAAGVHTGSLEYTVKWLQAGFDTAMLNNDVGFIRQAAGAQLAEARSTTGVANVHGA